MWIEMLETWYGPPAYLYVKGSKHDLPKSIVKQIREKGKRLWRKTIAPWLDATIIPNHGVPERPAIHASSEQEVQDEVIV